MKLNHIDVDKLRLDIVALPDKYVKEVMATYAAYEAVQKIDAVSLWERRPMKEVPGHTILQCKAVVREIDDESYKDVQLQCSGRCGPSALHAAHRSYQWGHSQSSYIHLLRTLTPSDTRLSATPRAWLGTYRSALAAHA